MTWVNVVLGVALVVAAILGSMILQRKIRGDETPMFGPRARKRRDSEDENEIEAFIAAYRAGQVSPQDLQSGHTDFDEAIPAGMSAGEPVVPIETLAATSTAAPAEPGVFLRPEVKLAYLTFRSGLRDHHIFANVLLRDLGFGTAVVGKVDLLVCDNSFKYVALVDIYKGEPVKDVAKAAFLSRVGAKHLILSSSAMPKPGQLHELIYGNQSG